MTAAALLCPGPGLSRLDASRLAEYATVVGVNRAATAFRCDWWAALDYPMLRDWQDAVIGSPKLLTRRQTWLDFHRRLRLREIRLAEDIAFPVTGWDAKTATAAIGLLSTLLVTRIDVFGADWTCEPADFDGVDLNSNDRTAERWTKEAETWGRMVAWLDGRGITVARVATASSA